MATRSIAGNGPGMERTMSDCGNRERLSGAPLIPKQNEEQAPALGNR